MGTFNIIDYKDEHHDIFRELNLEWLNHYDLAESHDLMILNDPKGTIIDNGGAIYLAEADGKIIGSAAIIKEHEGVYELAKMAVAPEWRGKGISKLLIEKCLNKAKELNAKKVTLFSNHKLETAISLYKKYGFVHVDPTDSPFETADIKMELNLV